MSIKSWIKFTKDCGDNKAGDIAEVDDETAKALLKMGVCEETDNPEEEAEEKIEKALADRDNKIVEAITKSLSKEVRVKFPAVARDDETKSLGEYLRCIGKMSANQSPAEREKAFNTLTNKYGSKAVMSEGTNADGGYTVPVEYAKEVLSVPGYEGAIFPDRIKVKPMGSKTLLLPALDQTVSPSAGNSAFYAGVSIGIVAEGAAPSDNTQPKWKQVSLTAKKCLATAVASNEVLDDSIASLESLLKDQFTAANTYFVNYNIFNGAGDTTSLTGIINHAATIKVARENATKFSLVDAARMYARLNPSSRKNAVWYINPLVWSELPIFGSNGGAASHFVWLGNDATGVPSPTLFGLPIVACESLPPLGTAGDVVLADCNYYALGMRTDPVFDSSPHYLFPSDQIIYRLKMRLDGKPQLTAPITLAGGGTVSPFVQTGNVAS